jgi:transposase InsO family protein
MLRKSYVLHKDMEEGLAWQYLDHESYNTLKEHAQAAGSPVNLYPYLLGKFSLWSPMLQKGYTQDPVFAKVLAQLKEGKSNGFTLHDGILYHTINNEVHMCIPDTPDCNTWVKNKLLDRVHQTLGHAGYTKTYQALSSNFYWAKIAKDTREYCKTCAVCQAAKTSTQKPAGLLHPLPIPKRPFSHITMDFLYLPEAKGTIAGLTFTHLWVLVDRFTKYTILIPLKKGHNAQDLVDLYMERVYPIFGLPMDIVTDQDPLFRSHIWTHFCKTHEIQQSMSTAYHPESDGQTEIANKAVLAILRGKLIDQGGTWLPQLPHVAHAINSSVDSSRGCTPNTLVLRFSPVYQDALVVSDLANDRPDGLTHAIWSAVQEKLNNARVEMTRQANKKRRPGPDYEIGELVKLHHSATSKESQYSKLEAIYLGPYPIVKAYPETDTFTIQTPLHKSGFLTVHTKLLEPWHPNNDTKFPSRAATLQGPVQEAEEGDRYEIERIVKHSTNTRTGRTRYYIKWEGWGHEHNTWQDEEDVDKVAKDSYHNKLKWAGKHQKKRAYQRGGKRY